MRAFQEASIDYGRADFGIVDGQLQIYEINTNPMIHGPHSDHPFADRVAGISLSSDLYFDAMRALDRQETGYVPRQMPDSYKMKRWTHRLIPGYQWSP